MKEKDQKSDLKSQKSKEEGLKNIEAAELKEKVAEVEMTESAEPVEVQEEEFSTEEAAKEAAELYQAEIAAETEKAGDAEKVENEEAPKEKEKPRSYHKKVATKRVKPLHGKKYRKIVEEIDLTVPYKKEEAVMLVKKTSVAKFDATVEIHVKVKLPNIRGVVSLPAGTGKERKVVAVTAANVEDFVKDVEAGKMNFDIVVATPDSMAKLSKVARVLGPRGLMPNPKSGTVTPDVDKAIAEFSSGRIEYKQDKGNVIHLGIGKVSMDDEALLQNLNALLHALPAGKIGSVVLSSTMGPGVKVSL